MDNGLGFRQLLSFQMHIQGYVSVQNRMKQMNVHTLATCVRTVGVSTLSTRTGASVMMATAPLSHRGNVLVSTRNFFYTLYH